MSKMYPIILGNQQSLNILLLVWRFMPVAHFKCLIGIKITITNSRIYALEHLSLGSKLLFIEGFCNHLVVYKIQYGFIHVAFPNFTNVVQYCF